MNAARAALALRRAALARRAMAKCDLCALECRVDRTKGPAGACRADAQSRVFYEGIEWAGESALVPTYVVSLSGCNMTCRFCLTGGPSQDARAGAPLDADALAARISEAHARTPLRSVTILGGEPSIHLDGALEIAARVPRGLLFVWKTNAFASAHGRRLISGIPDVVLADNKFGNDDCARRLAGVSRYTAVVRANLRSAARGGRLIVRHLLMPGHVTCCLAPVVEWHARALPDAPFSLMTGYLPTWKAARDKDLGRTNTPAEVAAARALVRARGVRLARWAIRPPPAAHASEPAPQDEVWIDRSGRICVDSASGPLITVLKRLGGEFRLRT